MSYNTQPEQYVIQLAGRTFFDPAEVGTPSDHVVRQLQEVDTRVAKHRLLPSMLTALFDDAVHHIYGDDETKARRVIARAERRFGTARVRKLVKQKSPLLNRLGTPNYKVIPDAYLIDRLNMTIVCYEIEDTNPLKADVLIRYGNLWALLEYFAWDLHLIAYDIYGHHRIVLPFDAGVMAAEIRRNKQLSAEPRVSGLRYADPCEKRRPDPI
jgi:hypothetical protein